MEKTYAHINKAIALFSLIIFALTASLAVKGLAAQNRPRAAAAVPAFSTLAGMKLEWTHFIGGQADESLGFMRAPILDRDGMLWFTGTTMSSDFPTTPDAFDRTYRGGGRWGKEDIFLTALNTRQPGIAYSTVLGGSNGPEFAYDFCFDNAKNILIVGQTGSSDYPTTGDALIKQFQGPDFRHADGVLTILGDGGRKMKYSTIIGGPKRNDDVTRIFIEPSGEITLFGGAGSLDFLPANTIRPTGSSADSGSSVLRVDPPDRQGSFVLRLDPQGRHIVRARFLPFGSPRVQRLQSGDYLVVGNTTDPNIATSDGAFDRSYNGGKEPWAGDIYVTRLSADLKKIGFATLFGGAGEDNGANVTVLDDGDFILNGWTTSKDLPVTADALQKSTASDDTSFLARFSADGRRLKYCTYLGEGGSGTATRVRHCVFDGHSKIYVVGETNSTNLPVTRDAAQPKNAGKEDGFIMAFKLTDNSLAYASYLGGSKSDGDLRLAIDRDGSLYVLGATDSDDFPAPATKPAALRGHRDIFVSKFSLVTTLRAAVAGSGTGRRPRLRFAIAPA